MNFLRTKRKGELAIKAAVIFLITTALLSIVVNVFAVLNKLNVQNDVLHSMTRYIEQRGCVDTAVYSEFNRLISKANLTDCTFDVTADNGKTDKIQFGDGFSVSLYSTQKIGLGGIVSIPLKLRQSAFGRSEKYWK